MTKKQVKVLDLYATLVIVDTVKIRLHGLLPDGPMATGQSVAQDRFAVDIVKALIVR